MPRCDIDGVVQYRHAHQGRLSSGLASISYTGSNLARITRLLTVFSRPIPRFVLNQQEGPFLRKSKASPSEAPWEGLYVRTLGRVWAIDI